MVEKRKLAEPEIKIRRAPRADEREADHESIRWRYDDDYTIDLAPYIQALRGRCWAIIAVAFAAAAMTALATSFVFRSGIGRLR